MVSTLNLEKKLFLMSSLLSLRVPKLSGRSNLIQKTKDYFAEFIPMNIGARNDKNVIKNLKRDN